MKRRITQLLLTTASAAAVLPLAGLSAGCVYHERYHPRREVIVEETPRREVIIEEPRREVVREEIIVEERPPAPKIEVHGERPTREHIWIEGHWTRVHNHWEWSSGHW